MLNVFVLSVNPEAKQKILAHLEANGFGDVEVVPGVRPLKNGHSPASKKTKKGSVAERHDCICEGHYKCAAKFARERDFGHFLLVEEDCRFTVPDAFARISKAVAFLDAHKKWGSLHVGQTPFGPVFPVGGISFLCRTLNPHGGHCYVLQRDTVLRLIRQVPKAQWKRPYMVEGLRKVPPLERFAFFPSIAVQNTPPNETPKITGRPALSHRREVRLMEGVALSMTGVGLVILILAATLVARWVAGFPL